MRRSSADRERVVDVGRDGFLKTMEVSCWSFMRVAHLAEPLMKNGGTMFTMTYYGSQMVVENYNVMAQSKAPARSLPSIDDVGNATAFLALDGAKLISGGVLYIAGGYHIID